MTNFQQEKGTILVVDDESIARDLVSGFLKKLGYQVAIAENGQEAIEVFEALCPKPIIMVTDIVMPHLDGPSLAQELRRDHPELCILFVSAYPEDRLGAYQLDPQLHRFLAKPFSLRSFSAAIRELASVAMESLPKLP